jgi:hypothetical protein
MRTASRALKPGGRLILVDAHPTGMMLDLETAPGAPLRVRYPYDSTKPAIETGQGSYADAGATLEDPRCVIWEHGLESIFNAMLGAGLELRTFRELDRVAWPMPALVKAEEYYWKLPESLPYVPIGLAMTAERSA